jgi:ribonuclease HI
VGGFSSFSRKVTDWMTVKRELLVYFDGGSKGNPGPAGVGSIAYEKNTVLVVVSKYIGETTNNVAEYTSLKEMLMKLEYHVKDKGNVELHLRCDSELVARQLRDEYKVKNPSLKGLCATLKKMLAHYSSWSIEAIPRNENRVADSLATYAIENALKGRK